MASLSTTATNSKIDILQHRAALSASSSPSSISVLSYNVLLPNSADGWWCYKMYSPRLRVPVTEEETSWPHRRGLLRTAIAEADADVVCVQETNAVSFQEDFAFMAELGYTERRADGFQPIEEIGQHLAVLFRFLGEIVSRL